MKLKCKKCKHEWNYKGYANNSKVIYYVTCPRCYNKLRVEKLLKPIENA
ncbi:MAG: DUF1660 family phage protein [Nanoarchaeota archaeon]